VLKKAGHLTRKLQTFYNKKIVVWYRGVFRPKSAALFLGYAQNAGCGKKKPKVQNPPPLPI
jgi:hypothetical protein